MSIVFESVSYTYKEGTPFAHTALRDLSVTIPEHTCMGIVGHTGSGKSTLMQLCNGLLRAQTGRITVDGVDITSGGDAAREARKHVGLVFQYPEYQLFEETVLKDIMFGPLNLGFDAKAAEEMAKKAADLVDLASDVLGASPFDLSGGQKRRVSIAGVLAMEPAYLLLDEPCAGLDPAGRRSMQALLRRLREAGTTIVMVSHSMDDVVCMCDTVLVLNDGQAAVCGTPQQVFRNADTLAGMRLALPEREQLACLLRARGIAVPEGTWDVDKLAELTCACMLGRTGDTSC